MINSNVLKVLSFAHFRSYQTVIITRDSRLSATFQNLSFFHFWQFCGFISVLFWSQNSQTCSIFHNYDTPCSLSDAVGWITRDTFWLENWKTQLVAHRLAVADVVGYWGWYVYLVVLYSTVHYVIDTDWCFTRQRSSKNTETCDWRIVNWLGGEVYWKTIVVEEPSRTFPQNYIQSTDLELTIFWAFKRVETKTLIYSLTTHSPTHSRTSNRRISLLFPTPVRLHLVTMKVLQASFLFMLLTVDSSFGLNLRGRPVDGKVDGTPRDQDNREMWWHNSDYSSSSGSSSKSSSTKSSSRSSSSTSKSSSSKSSTSSTSSSSSR